MNLGARIYQAMMDAKVPDELQEDLGVEIAKLVVRENRQIRKDILELRQSFLDGVEKEEEDYGSAVSAYAGEETCDHIIKEIIRPRVYFNTAEAKKREEEVDKLIKEIFESESDSESNPES